MTAPGPDLIPVLEIGGTHVTAALVDQSAGRVLPGTRRRCPLRPDASADDILASILSCADGLSGTHWGIALPGPFDYDRGIALFEHVGKFEALYGMDLGQALRTGLAEARRVTFLNDAHAFLLGEWATGAAAGHDRAMGITLGSGVGSAFIADGTVVTDGPQVPPGGRAHLLSVDGRPLEDLVSRRAIIKAFSAAAPPHPGEPADVREIADRARAGDSTARAVLDRAFTVLGEALGPWVNRFGATVLVVGGAMTGSWDVIEPPFRQGLLTTHPQRAAHYEVVLARHGEDAALLGAAVRVAAEPS